MQKIYFGVKFMLVLLGVIGTVNLWPCAGVASPAETGALKVVMLGDSNTRCDVRRDMVQLTEKVQVNLAKAQPRPVTVINAGKNGASAKEGYESLEAYVLVHDPDVVTISFGSNDAGVLTPAAYREWLGKIMQTLRQKTHAKFVLVTSTPFVNTRHKWGPDFIAKGGLDEYMDANFCAFMRELARDNNLPLCDLHQYFKKQCAEDPARVDALIQRDGVHLTDTGIQVAADQLAPVIASTIAAAGITTNGLVVSRAVTVKVEPAIR